MSLFGSGTGSIGTGIVFSLKDQFSNTADRIKGKFTELDMVSERVSNNISKSMNRMKVGFATLAVGAVLLLPLVGATKTAMAFSGAMSDVGAKANATTVELALMTDEAMRLGMATKFSAKEVAEGQSFLAMAGFKSMQIVSAMPGMLQLASSGQLDLATASDIASNVLTQFNMVASETGKVADILAFAATNSNQNITEMSEAMKYLGPTAAAYGISLAEASAATIGLSKGGLKAGLATRAFGTSLANLSKPTDMMLNKMKELNVDFFDARGEFIGLNNVIAEMERGLKGLTTEQRMNAIISIFQAGSIQEVTTLLNSSVDVMRDGREVTLKGSEALKEWTRQLENSGGTAKRVSEQLLDNLDGDITIAQSAMETSAIKVGRTIEPLLRPIVQMWTKIVALAGQLANHPIGKWFVRIVAITGTLLVVLGGVLLAMGLVQFAAAKAAISFAAMGKAEIAAAFATKGLSGGLRALAVSLWASMIPAAFATKGLSGGLRALAVSLWASMIPLLPWIIAGAALVGIFLLLNKGYQQFSDILNSDLKKGTSRTIGLMTKLGAVLQGVVMIWKSSFTDGFTLTKKMHDALYSIGMLDFVLKLGTWIVRVKAFFRGLWDGIMFTWRGIKAVFNLIGDAFDVLDKALSKVGININKNKSDMNSWENAGRTVAGIFAGIVMIAVIEMTVALWNMAAAVVAATWPFLLLVAVIAITVAEWMWLIKNWDKGIEWISATWGQFVNYLSDKFTGFVDWLGGLGTSFYDWGVNLVSSIWDGIASVWDKLENWFMSLIDALISPIKGALEFLGVIDGSEVNVNTTSNPSSPTGMGQTYAENKIAGMGGSSTKETIYNNSSDTVRSVQLILPDGRVLAETVNDENELNDFRKNG